MPQTGTAPAGSDLLVTGVPEPHEWALIGLSAAILAVMIWRRRRLTGQQPTGPAVG